MPDSIDTLKAVKGIKSDVITINPKITKSTWLFIRPLKRIFKSDLQKRIVIVSRSVKENPPAGYIHSRESLSINIGGSREYGWWYKSRVALAYRGIVWWFKRIFVSGKAAFQVQRQDRPKSRG